MSATTTPQTGLTGTIKSVIYVRVSKDRKNRLKSVTEQEAECRQAAATEGATVTEVYTDNDRSASRHARKARPAYIEMRERLASGQVDMLIIWEASRGSRELEDWAGLLNICRRVHIGVHVVTHRRTYDLGNPRDWRSLAEDGIDSEYEAEKTRERIMRAVRSNQNAGRPHGKLLYGYARKYDDRGHAYWDIDPKQADVVREAVERASRGESCYKIAQDFNLRGVPTPRTDALRRLIADERNVDTRMEYEAELASREYRWDLTQVKRLCVNPAYIAKRAVRDGSNWRIIGDAVWPAIVDEQTWQECIRILTDPKRKTVVDGAVKHLLSGIMSTPCGGFVRVQKNRGYLSYMCDQDFCTSIAVHKVESYVELAVKERLIAVRVREESDPVNADKRASARRKVDELRAYLDDFTREAARERLSASRVAAVERDVQAEISQWESVSRASSVPRLVRVLVADPSRWDDMSMPERRQTLRDMVRIELRSVGRGKRSYAMEDRVTLDWTEYELMSDPDL